MKSITIKITLTVLTLFIAAILASIGFPYVLTLVIAIITITAIFNTDFEAVINKLKSIQLETSHNIKLIEKINNPKNLIYIPIVVYLLYFIAGFLRYSKAVDRIHNSCGINVNCVSKKSINEGLNEGFHNTLYYLIKPYDEN